MRLSYFYFGLLPRKWLCVQRAGKKLKALLQMRFVFARRALPNLQDQWSQPWKAVRDRRTGEWKQTKRNQRQN